jgi:hypothetical protein
MGVRKILKVCAGVVGGIGFVGSGGFVGGGNVATATGMLGLGIDIGVNGAVGPGLPGERVS